MKRNIVVGGDNLLGLFAYATVHARPSRVAAQVCRWPLRRLAIPHFLLDNPSTIGLFVAVLYSPTVCIRVRFPWRGRHDDHRGVLSDVAIGKNGTPVRCFLFALGDCVCSD